MVFRETHGSVESNKKTGVIPLRLLKEWSGANAPSAYNFTLFSQLLRALDESSKGVGFESRTADEAAVDVLLSE